MNLNILDSSTTRRSSLSEDELDVRPIAGTRLVAWRLRHLRRVLSQLDGQMPNTQALETPVSSGLSTPEAISVWKDNPSVGQPSGDLGISWMFLTHAEVETFRSSHFMADANAIIWREKRDTAGDINWLIAGDSDLLGEHQIVGVDFSSHSLYNPSGEFLPTAVEIGPFYTDLNDTTYDIDAVAAHLTGRLDITWDSEQFRSTPLTLGEVPRPSRGTWDDRESEDDEQNIYDNDPRVCRPQGRVLSGRWAPDAHSFLTIVQLASKLDETPVTPARHGFQARPSDWSIGLAMRLLDTFDLALFRRVPDPITKVKPSLRPAVDAFLARHQVRPSSRARLSALSSTSQKMSKESARGPRPKI